VNVTTPDGRTLRVYVEGDENGIPVLAHHGTPSAGILYSKWIDDARERGICLIGYDRPGYGGSSRDEGRAVADCVDDARAIAAALGVERIATWGVSGGGPHVLACAALAPDLVASAACVAGVAPYDAEGLDYLAGMGETNVIEFNAALEGEHALRPLHERDAAEMKAGGAQAMEEMLRSLLTPVDAAALDSVGGFLHETMVTALEPGVEGWLDDDLAFVKPWGFDPAAVDVPLLLLQGEQDQFVPPAHFGWLAGQLPAAEARLEPDHGHLSIAEHLMGEVHAWLVEGRSIPRRS